MSFPFRIEFEPPTRADLRRVLRSWRVWTLLVGVTTLSIGVLLVARQHSQTDAAGTATLVITSAPSSARVEVDGRGRGETPTVLPVSPAPHRVTLRREGYAPVSYSIQATAAQTTTLHADLWLQTPHVQRLRPTFPGALITHVAFLHDGRVALTLFIPAGDEHQVWVVDAQGETQRVGPQDVHGPLALSRDGESVAYLAQANSKAAQRDVLDEVWLARRGEPRGARLYSLPASADGESLVDLAWAPDGQGLLLVGRRPVAGKGVRTRLAWLNPTTGEAKDLVTLPSEVLLGSYQWQPGGEWVALLTRVEQTVSLVLLNVKTADFRYLADLTWDTEAFLPLTPAAWSPDGSRLLYAAPVQERPGPSGWLFGGKPTPTLFLAPLTRPVGQRLGDSTGQFPAWREDGQVLAFAQAKSNAPLTLRAVESDGQGHDLGDIPLKVTGDYAARWDVAHAQAILTVRNTTWGASQPDTWLVQWRPEEAR
ncbi:MAG: PEGA domain-containing protein [Anaerolineae bacterium]|nr:PEGA domain-containing protein [Anaerolineae bacterium]